MTKNGYETTLLCKFDNGDELHKVHDGNETILRYNEEGKGYHTCNHIEGRNSVAFDSPYNLVKG